MPTLDWLNRDAAFKIANDVPYRLLEAVSEHRANVSAPAVKALSNQGKAAENAESRPDLFSALEPTSDKADNEKSLPSEQPAAALATEDNLLIQGDNLEALKALLPFYRGQVKCIFIDPPYNTKSAFEHYDDNLEHAQWLSMMLPRLQLLRELLTDDGSIWVTIDDNEGHYLKVMMDEVFGRGNFVATMVWEKRTTRENRRVFSFNHDFVWVYARSKSSFESVRNSLPLTADVLSRYKNPDGDSRGVWQSISANAQAGHATASQFYTLVSPGGKQHDPPKGTCWRYTKEKMEREIAAGNIWFGKDGNGVPRIKKFLQEGETAGLTPETIWKAESVGTNDEATKQLMDLMSDAVVFDNPKPERLLQRVIHIATNPNDLVLDSFLGSGTTAAVAQKMGRRWIGIEMGEHAKTHCLPRLQKVLDGEQGGISKTVNWQGGGSFRFMQLGAPVFDETGAIHPQVRFATLAAFVWMQETGVPWHKKKGSSPFLGTHNGVDYFLLFNGVLGDKRPNAGNVLTRAVLQVLTIDFPNNGRPRVIYGESNRLGDERLKEALVQFKSIPHEVVAR